MNLCLKYAKGTGCSELMCPLQNNGRAFCSSCSYSIAIHRDGYCHRVFVVPCNPKQALGKLYLLCLLMYMPLEVHAVAVNVMIIACGM